MPLDQQIKRVQDGQSRLDEGQELLIEDHELALLDLPSSKLELAPGKKPPRLYPVNQVTLLHEAFSHFGPRVTMLYLLRHAPAIIRALYQNLGHVLLGF